MLKRPLWEYRLASLPDQFVLSAIDLVEESQCLKPQLLGHIKSSFEASDKFILHVDNFWLKLPACNMPRHGWAWHWRPLLTEGTRQISGTGGRLRRYKWVGTRYIWDTLVLEKAANQIVKTFLGGLEGLVLPNGQTTLTLICLQLVLLDSSASKLSSRDMWLSNRRVK